eukprot:EG_transcript_1857
MPAGLQLRTVAPPTLRELVWSSTESLSCMPSIQKDAVTSPPGTASSAEPEWACRDDGSCTPTSVPPLGPDDCFSRRLSESGSSRISDASSLSYTHDPYSFGGPTLLPPSLSTTGGYFMTPLCDDPSPLGFYIAALSSGGPAHCTLHHHSCGVPAEDPLFIGAPGLLPLPATPAATVPGRNPLGHTVGGYCPCATCTTPPPSLSCGHPRPWRRLRAKRGFTFYACRDCGMKWRALTPTRAAELEQDI